MSEAFETSKDVAWLKELYFSDPSRTLTLARGETLLNEDQYNDRLFLILDGVLTGYLKDENNEQFEVLKSTRNMFVGVYSYFSPEHTSYLTLVADEPTTVAYIEHSVRERAEEKFATQFLPVIVHEVFMRQLIAQRITQERQAAIKKLYEKEKMATLGQLAAGLAHELNNAVGVLQKNTQWLTQALTDLLKNKKLQQLFLNMVKEGQSLNTITLRDKRRKLEKKFDIPSVLAKQLAKTTLTEEQIQGLLKENRRELETLSLVTEAGIVLHDMEVAATHATHVVQSVKILGLSNTENTMPTSIFETVNKALALTKTLLHKVTITIEKQTEGQLVANPGDLVQVWVNLIKNACESMETGTKSPGLAIRIYDVSENHYEVIVHDNGPGIPEHLIPRIFQPNFTTKVNGLSFGLGLGLSIVKKIVNHYKGSIRVESVPGDTKFIVQLPKP
jgi:signal transduction histidine kinase